jgi:hypothetical protein
MKMLSENRPMICDNVSVNAEGHVCFAGIDTTELAKKYVSAVGEN